LLLAAAVGVAAQQPPRRAADLKQGDAAPDFTLKDADGRKAVKLSDLKGKPVVLLFGSCT
jgi:cytochrome oxidase Cu insertion factor (SCO1/SenC/PrrC family)